MRKLKNFFIHLWANIIYHKFWILFFTIKFCFKLIYRALVHDFSKITPKELKGFITNIDGLKSSEYGSEDYFKALEAIRPSLKHHYSKNRHHPEFFFSEDEKINLSKMNLLDIVEMFIDWRSAVKKHKDQDFGKSIKINKERFNITDDLTSIFNNSLKF